MMNESSCKHLSFNHSFINSVHAPEGQRVTPNHPFLGEVGQNFNETLIRHKSVILLNESTCRDRGPDPLVVAV